MKEDATTTRLERKLKRRCGDALTEVLSCLDRQTLEYVLSAPTDLGAMMRAVAEYVVVIDAARERALAPTSKKSRQAHRKEK